MDVDFLLGVGGHLVFEMGQLELDQSVASLTASD